MPFELVLRYSPPLSSVESLDEALSEFLRMVGYLKEGEHDKGSTAYRLVKECLLGNPGRPWTIDELAATLKTTRPTIYRHLNWLKALDLMEEVSSPSEGGKARKGYRLRYGNLARAWDFVEANAQNSLKRYREGVDHIQKLSEKVAVRSPSSSR
jgi:predicted transcriptional regulator